jgi:phosphoribosylamine--glycine ligase
MNVLILGSGGREHALALAISKSKGLGQLYVAPGNPGCQAIAEILALNIENSSEVIDFCQARQIGLVVVGPEGPLVKGISDDLVAAGIACFGPSRAAARLEGSKGFTKELCRELGIPTAEFRCFTAQGPALAYVRARGAPIVIKADGLAAGKGVTVAMTLGEAESAVRNLFDETCGGAGFQIVIEDVLEGEEASLFVISDGHRVLPFGGAQDHKRVGDGDVGPNTGGMGAYSPTPILSNDIIERAMNDIIGPAIGGMAERGSPFRGLLFAGLMIGAHGPKLIEFNVRFGDPEAQAILSRFDDDLLEYLHSAATGRLLDREPRFMPKTALAVVLASKGYPLSVERGVKIGGLSLAASHPGVTIFQAATRRVGDDIVSDGGRVLSVTAIADSVVEARALAYDAIRDIEMPGGFYRTDIGMRAVSRVAK